MNHPLQRRETPMLLKNGHLTTDSEENIGIFSNYIQHLYQSESEGLEKIHALS